MSNYKPPGHEKIGREVLRRQGKWVVDKGNKNGPPGHEKLGRDELRARGQWTADDDNNNYAFKK